ncbi:MAG: HupE/UreJ family protein [Rhizobiaceae bacterium]
MPLIVALLLLPFSSPALGHFNLNLNVRIFHVEHLSDGLRIYLRTPMPYLVADRLGSVGDDGLPEPAPFTSNRMEGGKLVHYVDLEQIGIDPKGIGQFAADGLVLISGRSELLASVDDARIHRVGNQPPFATLEEAEKVFSSTASATSGYQPLYVGDTVVDVVLRYRSVNPVYSYKVSSSLNPGLTDQENTANLLLDYGPSGTKIYRVRGLLSEPVDVNRSQFAAIYTFILEGIRHILEGLDHVLFVICLVLGAQTLKALFWRITGFTIGHSITLTTGFFGIVPQGSWFVPAVETGIALSIIYAAIIAVSPNARQTGSELVIFSVTSCIGLLHGLGFSFVLHKILQVTSPDIWQSLLAFNVGVELGQLAIVALTWPIFYLFRNLNQKAWVYISFTIAALCGMTAVFWAFERFLQILSA